MSTLLLEQLDKFEIIEQYQGQVKGKHCHYCKLKAKSVTFEEASQLQNGIRYYIDYDGWVNYVSENMAEVWKETVMGIKVPVKKRNFGK